MGSGNLLTPLQATIEEGAGGWQVVSNCTIARTTDDSYSGLASLKVTAIGAGDVVVETTPETPVTKGEKHAGLGAFLADVTARNVKLAIRWFDSGGALLSTSESGIVAGSAVGWVIALLTASAPAAAAKARLRATIVGCAAAEVHYLDAASLENVSTLGPLITAEDVVIAAEKTLKDWMPSILAEIFRRRGLTHTGREPGSYEVVPDIEAAEKDLTPNVVVTTDGLQAAKRTEDGRWEAVWRIFAWVTVRGDDHLEVHRFVSMYVAAARAALLQHGIFGHKPRLIAESYNELDPDDARSIGGGFCLVAVRIPAIVDDLGGPTVLPIPPDYPDSSEAVSNTAAVTVGRKR